MQAPILEQLAGEVHEDELKILKMDVDENQIRPREFGVITHSDPSVQERRSSREASRRCSHQRPAQGYYRGIKLSKKPEGFFLYQKTFICSKIFDKILTKSECSLE